MKRDREYTDDDLVPVSIAARMIGVSPDTMRVYGDDGVVPVKRTPGNARRFRVGDLRRLLRDQRPASDVEDADDVDEEGELARSRVGAA